MRRAGHRIWSEGGQKVTTICKYSEDLACCHLARGIMDTISLAIHRVPVAHMASLVENGLAVHPWRRSQSLSHCRTPSTSQREPLTVRPRSSPRSTNRNWPIVPIEHPRYCCGGDRSRPATCLLSFRVCPGVPALGTESIAHGGSAWAGFKSAELPVRFPSHAAEQPPMLLRLCFRDRQTSRLGKTELAKLPN